MNLRVRSPYHAPRDVDLGPGAAQPIARIAGRLAIAPSPRRPLKIPQQGVSRRTVGTELAPKPRPVCGAILRIIGEPCARWPGHTHDHRSRAGLDARAKRRQK